MERSEILIDMVYNSKCGGISIGNGAWAIVQCPVNEVAVLGEVVALAHMSFNERADFGQQLLTA